jgi:hypothetical protein
MRLYIGVIRRHQKAAGRPVVIAIKAGDHQQRNRPCRGQDRTKMQAKKAGRRLLGGGGSFEKKAWHFDYGRNILLHGKSPESPGLALGIIAVESSLPVTFPYQRKHRVEAAACHRESRKFCPHR